MRASRLLSILILLQLRGRMTAEALAAEFEVSPRSIYRDIGALSAAGIPVYADRGPGGGFALLEGYRTRLTGLSAAESQTLLLQGLPGPAAELGLGEPLARARLKLLAAAAPDAAAGAARIGERFHLDPVGWHRRVDRAIAGLPTIAQAVWDGRRIAIGYADWPDAMRRTVEPLGLVLKAGQWYLVAGRDEQIRTYKVAKIHPVAVLDERFAYPVGFDLAMHWQVGLGRFAAGLRRGQATLLVAPDAMERIEWLGADMAEPIRAAAPDADGRRRATVPIEGVAHAAGPLLAFADTIEVLEPPALRHHLAELAARVVALYARAPTGPGQRSR